MNHPVQELDRARAQTDALFSAINPTFLYDRPIAERHRMVFYLGHLEAFDFNQLRVAGVVTQANDPVLDKLFEFGIDPEPGQLPSDTPADWPRLEQIKAYNDRSRALVNASVQRADDALVNMMIEHRHMHAETLAYILHNMEPEKKCGPVPQSTSEPGPEHEWIDFPAGEAELGRDREASFGWDNEYLRHSVYVPEFSLGRYNVSNADYLRFVTEGGPVPHYWAERGGRFFYKAVFGEIPLPLNWPVYVSLDNARAYAAYQGAGIMTEPQFHRAAPPVIEPDANLNYRCWDPAPIHESTGISQMIGNGWEWTNTVFAPFAGFQARPSYAGYSANFFDGKHYVLKGASPRTAEELCRRSFRNWFRPEYPYVYATFRLCQS